MPSGIGLEGAGVVEAVGPGVTWVKAGDRVAYAGGPPGAYAEVRLIPGGSTGQDARGHLRSDGRGHDAQGAHRAVSDSPHLQGAVGPDRAVPCGSRRGRPDRVSVAESARRHRDRYGRLGREGQARQGARLRAHHRLHEGELRRAREGDHRRQERAGGLRLGRARTPSWARSTAWSRAACWSCSATARARSRRST